MKKTYLFYDLETTGLNPCFDQILQFAAIRTDLNLNPIDEHYIEIKLNPDVIPSPEAIMTHRISIEKMQEGITEYNAIQQIHRLLNTPGTISVGYNTLGFDDEFLRFSFYRNLLSPYTHQYANQCGRMDIYPITLLYYLFKNKIIKWPMKEGRISLKLEALSELNELAKGQAHHAMVDVRATIALAKILIQEKDMWNFIIGYFDKKTDLARLQQLTADEGICVTGKLGPKLNFQSPVLHLGQHQHYKNQSLWLRLDTEELTQTTADNINDKTWVIKKRAGEQHIILPMKERYLKQLDEKRMVLANQNKQWLMDNPNKVELIRDYHQHFKYPFVENVDVDAALYQIDFPTPADEMAFLEFHKAPLNEKYLAIDNIVNPIRREQAIRIVGRQYPQYLSETQRGIFRHFINALNQHTHQQPDYRNEQRLTKPEALKKIQTLLDSKTCDAEQIALLKGFCDYLGALV